MLTFGIAFPGVRALADVVSNYTPRAARTSHASVYVSVIQQRLQRQQQPD